MIRKYIYILAALALLSSCADDFVSSDRYLNGKDKSPISVGLLIDGGAQSRAVDNTFDDGDQFVAYLRHVTWNGSNGDARVPVAADKAPLLVTFTKGSSAMTAFDGSDITPLGTGVALGLTSDNTKVASDLTASPVLYWDDMSNSSSADTDIRTSGHYLQSYYGYCYNGGTASTALDEGTGVLGWTVNNDQFTNGIKTSDLLWSAEQTPVEYKHAVSDRTGLILPYTHAMSKVTLEIVLDEGFDVYPVGDANAGKATAFVGKTTTPVLYANRVTQTTAPTYAHSTTVASGDDRKIQMRLADNERTNKKHRVYEAIIAPTVMKNGNMLAQVSVDGNNYDINLTDAVLTTDPAGGTSAWNSQLRSYSIADGKVAKTSGDYSAENGGITLPGVNYRLKITLNKQKIEVKAYITNWTDVNASIDGKIMFSADVKNSSDVAGTEVTSTSSSFDLWRSIDNNAATDYDADSSADGIQKAATYTYSTDKWVGSPELYWANGSTSYFFRALAKVDNPSTYPNDITSVGGNTSATQGTDLLWAQTSEHKAMDAAGNLIQQNGADKIYAAGAAINPRTGDVPLTFEHAMSKISVILKNADGIEDAAKVNLTDAKISIINLYNGGTINIKSGDIETLTSPVDANASAEPRTILNQPVVKIDEEFKWLNNIVIPQSLVKDRNGNDRTTAPTYYTMNELTPIYPNASASYLGMENTSLGTGTPTYYLTTDLVLVQAYLYNAAEAKTYNAGLTGAVSTSSVKTPAVPAVMYDLAEFNQNQVHKSFDETLFNSQEFSDAAKGVRSFSEYNALLSITQEMFDALSSELKVGWTIEGFNNQKKHKEFSEDVFNSLSPTAKGVRSFSEYNALPSITQEMFNALPEALRVKTPAQAEVYYTQAEADEYNAALPGAVKVGDIRIPAYYKLPPNAPTPHNSGDMKKAGNKIMLYVTLADGTIYSIDLATCKDSSDNAIDKWERGKHYTYTISLAKEKITFRALVKDWIVVNGGGNATLDWD